MGDRVILKAKRLFLPPNGHVVRRGQTAAGLGNGAEPCATEFSKANPWLGWRRLLAFGKSGYPFGFGCVWSEHLLRSGGGLDLLFRRGDFG